MRDFYELIEHTGDVGIVVRGASLKELFINCAIAMMEIITNREEIKTSLIRDIEVRGLDAEDLLVRWLSEINYCLNTYHELYRNFEVEEFRDTYLKGFAKGESYDKSRHELNTEIKAVTYHGLYVKQTEEGYEARIIFDI